MNNVRSPYAELKHKHNQEGVFPYQRDWIVYVSKMLRGKTSHSIVADRKFKSKEAAEIYYKQLKLKPNQK